MAFSLPVSEMAATVCPVAESSRRRSSRIWLVSFPRARYDPRMMKSLARFLRTCGKAAGGRLSISDRPRSIFVRAMVSAGTVRNCSPAASSAVNISESAVEIQAVSWRLERFLKPSIATDGRIRTWTLLDCCSFTLTLTLTFLCFHNLRAPHVPKPAARASISIAVANDSACRWTNFPPR